MKTIAFTSCCHAGHELHQITWERIGLRQPDFLILMGDNIYMDFGAATLPLMNMKVEKFGRVMQDKYRIQFEHPSFNRLVCGGYGKAPEIMAIWDDHDFAWNNSYGEGSGPNVVPADKKKVSRALFRVFLESCRRRRSAWPTQDIKQLLAQPLEPEGIYESRDLPMGGWTARLIMLDGRYHREAVIPRYGTLQRMLGQKQSELLHASVLGDPQRGIARADLPIVVAGTTLREGGEAWKKKFPGAQTELLAMTRAHGGVLLLSGDIHENGFYPDSPDYPGCVEAVASGASLFKWAVTALRQNYGMVTLNDDRSVRVQLYDKLHANGPNHDELIEFPFSGGLGGTVPPGAGKIRITPLRKPDPMPAEAPPVGVDLSLYEP